MFSKKSFLIAFCACCLWKPVFSMEPSFFPFVEKIQDGEFLDEEESPYNVEGLECIQKEKMPKHISFIMDGNRRWAVENELPETAGHIQGGETFLRILKFFCTVDVGVETLSFYAFSTENWKRTEHEVSLLMNLFVSYIDVIFPYLEKYSISLKTIGDLTKLPIVLQETIQKAQNFPVENPKLTLIIALNYGGRDELKRAFSAMAQDLEKGSLTKEDISEELIQSYLDTGNIKDPELLIRTSGERRISNFLIWQLAYSEFYFSPSFWPDFTEQELVDILLDFQQRERRFGGSVK